jgi:hypothetical protein
VSIAHGKHRRSGDDKMTHDKSRALIRALQQCGLVYVATANTGPCQRCGFVSDLRLGACLECCDRVAGEHLGDGIHKLWDKTHQANVWIVWMQP